MRMMNKKHAMACILGILLSSMLATGSRAESLTDLLFGKRTFGSNIVALAKDFEGLNERTDRRSLKAITGVDPVQTPWCAAFINALLDRQGMRGSDSNAALSFLSWGVKTQDPRPGDIVVMRGHVTIFVAFSEDRRSFFGIGGNQNNSVRVGEYSVSKVISYRTYAEVFVPEAMPKKKLRPTTKKKYSKKKQTVT